MVDPDQVVARNDERMRNLDTARAARLARYRNRQRAVSRSLKRAGLAGVLAIFGFILWGWMTGGIGIGAFLLAVVLVPILMIVAALTGAEPAPSLDRVAAAPPSALPALTERWLNAQRKQLPLLAAPQVDTITAQLATLEGQLANVPAGDPVAQDLNRLLSKHLPELVDRYTRVPETQRAQVIDPDGRTVEKALVDGLKVVGAELARASDSLAAADRDALAVQQKFLESRYQGEAP
jgi:uncharacterized membrane protein